MAWRWRLQLGSESRPLRMWRFLAQINKSIAETAAVLRRAVLKLSATRGNCKGQDMDAPPDQTSGELRQKQSHSSAHSPFSSERGFTDAKHFQMRRTMPKLRTGASCTSCSMHRNSFRLGKKTMACSGRQAKTPAAGSLEVFAALAFVNEAVFATSGTEMGGEANANDLHTCTVCI